METKEMICINCPMGCPLSVTIDGNNITVTGNTCPRGETYAKTEVTNPTRIVTSSVTVEGGVANTVSCKTEADIPKGKIFDIIRALADVKVQAPVSIGDVILQDVCGTGVNVVATKDVAK